MLTGNYTPPQILEIINGQYGYRTPKRGKVGGHSMARSQIYKMFKDSYYYGPFEFPEGSGQWWDGQHETMITEERILEGATFFSVAVVCRVHKRAHSHSAERCDVGSVGQQLPPTSKLNDRRTAPCITIFTIIALVGS